MSSFYKTIFIIVTLVAITSILVYQMKVPESESVTTFDINSVSIDDIKFIHTDENEGEDLIITSDKDTYQGFSGTTIYFNINSLEKKSENIAVQFHFTDPNAKIVRVYQHKKADNYWLALPIQTGEIPSSGYAQSLEKRKEVEGEIYAQSHTSFSSSGETEYFMAEVSYPSGTPGQFLIEAFGESGSYGILDPWYDSGWAYRKKITINPDGVAGGLINFPLLFSRVDPDLRDTVNGGKVASSTGGDILFTDSNDLKIPHEIEKYASSTGELIAWVKVPFMSSTSTRDIYIYYGTTTVLTVNQASSTAVWDSSYEGVWHLKETDIDGGAGDIKDSTSNVNNGATAGMDTTDQVVGKINGSFDFDGTNDTVSIGDVNDVDGISAMTVSAWAKADDLTNLETIFSKFNDGTASGWRLALDDASTTEQKDVYTTLDADTAFEIPVGVTSITVKAWGAGGGGGGASGDTGLDGGNGGGGGFTQITLSVTAGDDFIVRVGGGGGGGLASGGSDGADAGGGGGYSGVFDTTPSTVPLILAAAGGGGSGADDNGASAAGGGGGGATGVSGETAIGGSGGGSGGTQSAGGDSGAGCGNEAGTSDGASLLGGDGGNAADNCGYGSGTAGSDGGSSGSVADAGGDGGAEDATNSRGSGGAGGAGYYGGGGGGANDGAGGGGGGGSSYTHPDATATSTQSGSGQSVANSGDSDYIASCSSGGGGGSGGVSTGQAGSDGVKGCVVITYTPTSVPDEMFFQFDSAMASTSDNVLANSAFGYWTAVFDGSLSGNSNRLKMYFNGIQKTLNFVGTIPATVPNTAHNIKINGTHDSADFFDGVLDEVRLSTSARTAEWVLTEYNNQTSPNTFYSYSGSAVEIRSSALPGVKIRGGVKVRGGVKFR